MRLYYNKYFTFYKYHSIKDFDDKRSYLSDFKYKLEEVYYDTQEINPDDETQEKDLVDRKNVINSAPKSYDKLLNKYETQYNNLPGNKKKMINVINKPGMLSPDCIEYDLAPLEGDEEVKLEPEETTPERVKLNPRKRKTEGTGLNILTLNKLLTRLPILLAQVKAGNNSCKLKNQIRQILYLLYQHNKSTKPVSNDLIKSS